MKTPIQVFYSRRMDAESGRGVSPSARKPGIIAKALRRSDIPVDFFEPTPLREKEIAVARDPKYVGGVLTNDELMESDRRSFQIAKDLGVGIACTLAGDTRRTGTAAFRKWSTFISTRSARPWRRKIAIAGEYKIKRLRG